MGKCVLFLLVLLSSQTLIGQTRSKPKEDFYLWNKDWKPTARQEEAAFFGRLVQKDDSTWQWDIYN